MLRATERFSNRVENYIRCRPRYPVALIECLRAHCHLRVRDVVADVGSGTGILSELFLRHGNTVYGVEPNREMRQAAERLLRRFSRFNSVDASAEHTTLQPRSIDLVVAGQSFHWFERNKAKAEFQRILKPEGWVVLAWNERRETLATIGHDYERLLKRHAPDYESVGHKQIDAGVLRRFFSSDFGFSTFPNHQTFDFEGLKGRLLSSSYAPESSHPQHLPMVAELRRIFDAHQTGGVVTFEYDTNVYYGRV